MHEPVIMAQTRGRAPIIRLHVLRSTPQHSGGRLLVAMVRPHARDIAAFHSASAAIRPQPENALPVAGVRMPGRRSFTKSPHVFVNPAAPELFNRRGPSGAHRRASNFTMLPGPRQPCRAQLHSLSEMWLDGSKEKTPLGKTFGQAKWPFAFAAKASNNDTASVCK